MKFLHFILLSIIFCAPVSAETIEGWICQNADNSMCLIAQDGRRYQLSSKNFNIYKDLQKLEYGDYLVAQGQTRNSDMMIFVSHINYVGLRKILGSWETTLGLVYNFDDFTTLSISNSPYGISRYHYSISPQAGPDWSFFAVKDGIAFARMQLSHAFMKLHFYDQDTGEVHSTIQLRQIYKK